VHGSLAANRLSNSRMAPNPTAVGNRDKRQDLEDVCLANVSRIASGVGDSNLIFDCLDNGAPRAAVGRPIMCVNDSVTLVWTRRLAGLPSTTHFTINRQDTAVSMTVLYYQAGRGDSREYWISSMSRTTAMRF
jgi:hypothetical protein